MPVGVGKYMLCRTNRSLRICTDAQQQTAKYRKYQSHSLQQKWGESSFRCEVMKNIWKTHPLHAKNSVKVGQKLYHSVPTFGLRSVLTRTTVRSDFVHSTKTKEVTCGNAEGTFVYE